PLSGIDPSGLECVWDDGSYDSENDGGTGSVGQCQDQGGTWIELGQMGGWSAQADASLGYLATDIQSGAIGSVMMIGADGEEYSTFYNSAGQTTETVTPDAIKFYAYGSQISSVSQMLITPLCSFCHDHRFTSTFTPQQIAQFAATHGWTHDFLDLWHKNFLNGGEQLRSDDATCSVHVTMDLDASAGTGGTVGDWHVDQYNPYSSPVGALGHLGEVATGGPAVEGSMATGQSCLQRTSF